MIGEGEKPTFQLVGTLPQSPTNRGNHFPSLHPIEETLDKFCQSTPLLMGTSSETLRTIHHKDWLTLTYWTLLTSQLTILRWQFYLLGCLAAILMVLLFWIYFHFLTVVFVLQCLSHYWETLTTLFSQVSLSFEYTNCLSVFDDFLWLARKGLTSLTLLSMLFSLYEMILFSTLSKCDQATVRVLTDLWQHLELASETL